MLFSGVTGIPPVQVRGDGEDGFELHQLRMILSCEMSWFLHQLVSQMRLLENSCLQLLGERD